MRCYYELSTYLLLLISVSAYDLFFSALFFISFYVTILDRHPVIITFFLAGPLLIPHLDFRRSTVSRRSRRSRDERDVLAALSRDSYEHSTPATPPPGKRTGAGDPPSMVVDQSDLANLIAASVRQALASNTAASQGQGGLTQPTVLGVERLDEMGDGDEDHEEDVSLPSPGGIRFGVDANPPPEPVVLNDAPAVQPPPVPDVTPAPVCSGTDPVVDAIADTELPGVNEALPNWRPRRGVMAWAASMLDSVEWSNDDRKLLDTRFVPEPEFAHIFEAVHMPQDLMSCMKNKATVTSDYLFNRFSTETYLYNANQDITTSYKPLLEVISSLKDVPGQGENRILLAKAFQGLVAATVKLSRGRRELARRFVPLENAQALFKTKPSHSCIFGGSSLDEAVAQAVKDSTKNKQLVYVPKKPKQPFRGAGAAEKGFQRYQKRFSYETPRYRQSYQKSRSEEDSYREPSQKSRRKRGKGGRARGSRASNSKAY